MAQAIDRLIYPTIRANGKNDKDYHPDTQTPSGANKWLLVARPELPPLVATNEFYY